MIKKIFNNYVYALVISKIFFALTTLYFFAIFLKWDMFTYPDFYSIYNNCTEKAYTNILFSKLFCNLPSIIGINISFKSLFFIFLAALLNTFMLVGYFKIFEKYLTKHGKYLLIILLVTHPYLNVYFFRFYTDLFASLGIFLIIIYRMRNANIDTLFLIAAFILMNFRVALIPVFFAYGLWEIYSNFKKNNLKASLNSAILILFAIASYIPTIEFSIKFININEEINFIENVAYNIFLVLGYRDSIGISKEFFALDGFVDILSFITSLILVLVHGLGLYGVIKFSFKYDKSLLIVFIYILLPLLAIAHLRYLLPLIPLLLFGFSYLFMKKNHI